MIQYPKNKIKIETLNLGKKNYENNS